LSPGWNNIPRYPSNFTSLTDISPKLFVKLLRDHSIKNCPLPPLINAWNEWSEGAAIEPCVYYKDSYLAEIKKVFG
jgi:hypothetical protein